jgi:hypothetical protein
MKLHWHTDNRTEPPYDRITEVSWPHEWPMPRVGETVVNERGETVEVTAVEWYPHGDGDPNDPFCYVVTHRPGFGR